MIPKGVKVIGEWSAIGGGRVFTQCEIGDGKAGLAPFRAWSDLGRVEVFPVLPTEDALRFIAR